MTFGYRNGRFAQLASSMVESMDLSAAINGTDGWISIDPPFWVTSTFAVHTPTSREVLFAGERRQFELRGSGYIPMIREVTATVQNGGREHAFHSLEEMVRTFELLDLIRQTASETT